MKEFVAGIVLEPQPYRVCHAQTEAAQQAEDHPDHEHTA